MPESLVKQNLYVGPRPFEDRERNSFFGREREIVEIVSLVFANRLLVIYAASGAGKTSLMHAGVIPALREEGFEVLQPLRFRPSRQNVGAVRNFYVNNALLSAAPSQGDISPRMLAQTTLAEFLQERNASRNSDGEPLPRVLIFDQFEELFTLIPPDWQERREFFRQIDEALSSDRYLRAVLVLREEHIAALDSYASIFPDQLRRRFRIERLRRDAALQAIIRPLEMTDRYFETGVAEYIVDNLLAVRFLEASGEERRVIGEYVEPVQLQVVCQSLWNGLEADRSVITMDDAQALGDVDTALSVFYERSIQQVIQLTEVKEGTVRQWFERALLTPAGTRATVYRGAKETGGIDNTVVDLLEASHILRAELRDGARWYELSHDRFIAPIQESNHRWLLQFSHLERRRNQIEESANRWMRNEGMLLTATELQDARRLEKELNALGLDYSDIASAYLTSSQIMGVGPGARRWLIYGLIAITGVSLILAAVGWLK